MPTDQNMNTKYSSPGYGGLEANFIAWPVPVIFQTLIFILYTAQQSDTVPRNSSKNIASVATINGKEITMLSNPEFITGQEGPTEHVEWRVHTPKLLDEILVNADCSILKVPLCILGRILANVGERAIIIDDPELNKLMIQLTIYSIADPASEDYDPETVRRYMNGDWDGDKSNNEGDVNSCIPVGVITHD